VNDETLTAQRPVMAANPIPEAVRAQAAAWFAEYDKHNYFTEMLALDAYAAGHAAAQQPAAVDEAMVFRLAVWMAKHDGHDDPHHLIWEGSPPEPWGEVWNRYEDDARAALTAALATQQQGQAADVELTRDAERYQWLRECAWLHPEAAPACAIFDVDGSMLRSIDGSDLDAAIDQARGTASEAKS
jgi:hypothetical protein